MNVRVRIAPSPTGIPHIGNTRTALFNYLFAKKNKGKFLLRIEDTDRKRIVPGAKEAILEILEWLEIPPDEIYTQSERLEIYKKHIKTLLGNGVAYEKEGAVWIKVSKDRSFSWRDVIGDKDISFKGESIEDFVAIKSDGFPTYHFASVVDDHLMEISHVIRGDEWISSTPKHIFLYESFEWKKPIFAHLPVVLGPDRAKLSKRHGAKSVLEFRDEGYMREALLNFMALLGWNPGADDPPAGGEGARLLDRRGRNREIMSIDEMIEFFDLSDVNTNSPIFDVKKLEWMNGEYIRKIEISKLKQQILEFDPTISSIPNFEKYIPLTQTRMKTLTDFRNLVENKQGIVLTQEQKKLAQGLVGTYQGLHEWRSTPISTATIAVRDEVGATTKDVYTVLTGSAEGLPFEQKLEIQGQAGTISSLEAMLKK